MADKQEWKATPETTMLTQPHTSVLQMVSEFEQRFYSNDAIFNTTYKKCVS